MNLHYFSSPTPWYHRKNMISFFIFYVNFNFYNIGITFVKIRSLWSSEKGIGDSSVLIDRIIGYSIICQQIISVNHTCETRIRYLTNIEWNRSILLRFSTKINIEDNKIYLSCYPTYGLYSTHNSINLQAIYWSNIIISNIK